MYYGEVLTFDVIRWINCSKRAEDYPLFRHKANFWELIQRRPFFSIHFPYIFFIFSVDLFNDEQIKHSNYSGYNLRSFESTLRSLTATYNKPILISELKDKLLSFLAPLLKLNIISEDQMKEIAKESNFVHFY
jgi:hypothetical protein